MPERLMPDDHPTPAYAIALAALRAAGIPHLVGGGLAVQHYGRRRATKDLDVFIRPADAERALHALAAAGFTVMDTDQAWLKKAVRPDVLIDLILVSMGSIKLTDQEIARGVQIELEGVPMRIFKAEDMLLRKIYVIRDEGPDWMDAFSILETMGCRLDWTLLERPELDPRPLAGFLLVADARVPGVIPGQVLARHVKRAERVYDPGPQRALPAPSAQGSTPTA